MFAIVKSVYGSAGWSTISSAEEIDDGLVPWDGQITQPAAVSMHVVR